MTFQQVNLYLEKAAERYKRMSGEEEEKSVDDLLELGSIVKVKKV